MQVGEIHETRSGKPHECEICGGRIRANQLHYRVDNHDHERRFTKPSRVHAPGWCVDKTQPRRTD